MHPYIFFLIGTLNIAWAISTFVLRDRKPEWFAKYAALREKYGDSEARFHHTLRHVLSLIVIGVVCIAYGYTKL